MTTPLVSIIIPLYNAEKYIDEAINSIMHQTWANKELIIIDDGSTDNSLATAKKYVNDWITVKTQQNKGAGVARNEGLKLAGGDFIQFMDADDLLSPNKIEEQVNQLIKLPNYLALCATVHFHNGTRHTNHPVEHEWYAEGTKDPVDFLIKLYGGSLIGDAFGGMIQTNAWLSPRHLIVKAGPWNDMRNPDDDGEFFCRVILASEGIAYAKKAVNYYRKFKNNSSLSGQKNRESAANVLKAIDLKSGYLTAKTTNPAARIALGRLYYDSAFSFYPRYRDLANEALDKAKALSPGFHFNPYNNGISLLLSKIVGWKPVRRLQHLRNNLLAK